jgi:hypothetical protein
MEAEDITMAKIRAKHLDLIQHECEGVGLSLAEKSARKKAYDRFYINQKFNRPSFSSSDYAAFEKSKARTKAELAGITELAKLINSSEATKTGFCQAMAKASDNSDTEHKEILNSIRNMLWTYKDDARVNELSQRLFGLPCLVNIEETGFMADIETVIHEEPHLAGGIKIDTFEHYKDHSTLQFDYDYLQDVYKLIISDDIELVSLDLTGSPSKSPKIGTVLYSFISNTKDPSRMEVEEAELS